MVAAATGSLACLQLLVQQGSDLNFSNNDGDTPLHVAVRSTFVARIGCLVHGRAETIKYWHIVGRFGALVPSLESVALSTCFANNNKHIEHLVPLNRAHDTLSMPSSGEARKPVVRENTRGRRCLARPAQHAGLDPERRSTQRETHVHQRTATQGPSSNPGIHRTRRG